MWKTVVEDETRMDLLGGNWLSSLGNIKPEYNKGCTGTSKLLCRNEVSGISKL